MEDKDKNTYNDVLVDCVGNMPSTSFNPQDQSLTAWKLAWVREYLRLNKDDLQYMEPGVIANDLLLLLNAAIDERNSIAPKGKKIKSQDEITTEQIAECMSYTGNYKLVAYGNKKVLAIYMPDGDKAGLWYVLLTGEDMAYFAGQVKKYSASITTGGNKGSVQEVYNTLVAILSTQEDGKIEITADADYVAVANGVWSFSKQKLISFEQARKDGLAFTSKTKIKYNPNAKNKTFYDEKNDVTHTVDSIVSSWFGGDDEHVKALWEAWHSMLRPHCKGFMKMILVVDPKETGDNGKTTAGKVPQAIFGNENYTAQSLSDLTSDSFELSSLLHTSAIISTDSDTNEYIPDSNLIKRLPTGDSFTMRIKFKEPITAFEWHGRMWFTFNGFPHFKDTSEAIDKRCYLLDFSYCFRAVKNVKIQTEFLQDEEVLEYILKRLLEMNIQEYTLYDFQKELLGDFRKATNPVDEFLDYITDDSVRAEAGEQHHHDGYSIGFLWDMFKGYYRNNYNRDSGMKRQQFVTNIRHWAARNTHGWVFELDGDGTPKKVGTTNAMKNNPEYFIEECQNAQINNMAKYINWAHKDAEKRYLLKTELTQYRGIRKCGVK